MDIDWTNVVACGANSQQATLLTNVLAAAQARILAYVNSALECGFFGGDCAPAYTEARSLLAAHLAVLGMSDVAPAGPLTGETEGGLERTYAALAYVPSSSTHPETSYGRLYDSLVRGMAGRAGTTT